MASLAGSSPIERSWRGTCSALSIIWLLLILSAITGSAEAAPKHPVPHPPHKRLRTGGYIRAYFFNFQKASNIGAAGVKALPPNQAAVNFGIRLHAEYDVSPSLTAGASYYGADPLYANGPCSDVANYVARGACPPSQAAKIDNTLPGFALSTLGEAYLDYHRAGVRARIGNQLINTPWAWPVDGRLKPIAFQGISSEFALGNGLSLSVDRMTRFEDRNSSAFLPVTMVTKPSQFVPGMLYTALTYKKAKIPASGTVALYNFYDIANLFYAEGNLAFDAKSPLAPFAGVQYVRETSTGRAYAGLIDNQTVGAQAGVHLGRNFVLTAGFDHAPWRSQTVRAASPAQAIAPFFTPTGGPPVLVNHGAGVYTVYYGGIAGPYTDAYSGDPTFTWVPTLSMAQRRSAGDAEKISLSFRNNNGRLQGQIAEARLIADNGAGSERMRADYIDAMYFFGPKIGAGYRGLSLRERYVERYQTNVAQFGGLPLLKYNRLQFQYQF